MTRAFWQRPYFGLLLLYLGLLLPSSFPFSYIKAGWCLISAFVLPGYLVLSLAKRPLRFNGDLFQKALLSLAVSLALLIVPWIQVFLLRLDLRIAVATILGLDLALLLLLLVFDRPGTPIPANAARMRIPMLLSIYITFFVFLTLIFGSNVFGDAYSYMTWIRNIYVGDVSPQANVHAAWEAAYPSFMNILAPLLMGYAICAKMAGVDPNVVWAVVPAFWLCLLFVVNYNLTEILFKKHLVSNIAIIITPLVMVYVPSMLGDSHATAIFVLAPLVIYLSLRYILSRRPGPTDYLSLALAGLVGFVLAAEHLQNLIYVLYSIGAFGAFTLMVDIADRRKSPTSKRSLLALLVILLCTLSYILWTVAGVQSVEFDASSSLDDKLASARGSFFLGLSPDLLVVHPKSLLSGYGTSWLGLAALVSVLTLGKRCYRTPSGRFVCSNILIVLLISLNPILVPFLSKMATAQMVYRMGEMLPVVPILSFALFRICLTGLAWFRDTGSAHSRRWLTRKRSLSLLGLAVLIGLLWTQHGVHVSLSAINLKIVHIVYAPEGANPNWFDLFARQRITAELENPPFPILEQPTRLNRVLDSEVLRFIEENTPANSVFFTDQLAEYSLPAYTNQLTFAGRRAWPKAGRDYCQRILSGELNLRRSTEVEQLIADRLETLCTVLAPETDVATIENLLLRHADEIDYILVTPSSTHLEEKLNEIEAVQAIYNQDGFIIYQLGGS